MSKADWSFLEHLLEEGQEYSTGIGRVWLTVLFLFRMLVLGTAAESAWDDEQADFVCNTQQPGCTAVCYDKAFPISHFRYFVLQVIFVSTPTIFYFGYVALRVGKETKEENKDKKWANEGCNGSKRGDIVIEGNNNCRTKDSAQEKKNQEDGGKGRKIEKTPPEVPKLKGRLLCAYALSILVKIFLEIGFIIGLWFLYDGFFIAPKFECTRNPCPHTVDCFVSRPTEKTIFTIYTQVIAAISLLLNLIELFHLLQIAISHRLEKRYHSQHQDFLPNVQQVIAQKETPELQSEASQSCASGIHVTLPTQGESAPIPNAFDNHGDQVIEMNWGPGEDGKDLLPSYVNCLGAMRTTHSPRVHYKKHAHHTGKNAKAARKGHTKQKHYV